MIYLGIKLYKEKLDGTIEYAEPSLHPRNQFVLQDANEIEDALNIFCANSRGDRKVDA